MKKHIFIINGSGGVGKDTFCSMVNEISINRSYSYSSVTKIKEIASELGWEGKKTEKDRKFLSDLKDLSTQYNDLPFRQVCKQIELFYSCGDYMQVLFLHIREPEEIKKVVDAFPEVQTILLKSSRVESVKSNHADKDVENYVYDFVIYNNEGLEDLKHIAENFYEVYCN